MRADANTPVLAQLDLRSLRKNKLVAVAMVVLALIVFSALFADLVAPHDPYKTEISLRNSPPGTPSVDGGFPHILGTDALGRDVFSRIIFGGRISLSVGFLSVVVSGFLGFFLGLLCGYFGGKVDTVIMRLVDLQMSMPSLLIALLVLYVLGSSFINVILILAVTRWMVYARVTRGMMLTLREEPFVEASKVLGASHFRTIFRHMVPNLLGPIMVVATLELAIMLLTEASLSFLGLGIQPPLSSWGLMLSQGREYLTTAWWLVAMPGIAILLTTLSVNLIATWLRTSSR
jgi:peptide/nickel transport system permease protein